MSSLCLIDLNRRQRVEDIRVLRDQSVVAISEPGIQVVPEYDVVQGNQLWAVHSVIVA